jgi:hypothetical protein
MHAMKALSHACRTRRKTTSGKGGESGHIGNRNSVSETEPSVPFSVCHLVVIMLQSDEINYGQCNITEMF